MGGKGRSMRLAGLVAISVTVFASPGRADTCGDRERESVLREMQQAVESTVPGRVESLRSAVEEGGPLHGYQLTHGDVFLKGMGVVLAGFDLPEPRPELLTYRPVDESSPDRWLDFEGEDGPYRLTGWGYIPKRWQPGSEAPDWRCIQSGEWFVHRAGWHLKDGGMQVTAGAMEEPERPEDPNIWYWHPAAWDIHVWLREGGVPEITIWDESVMDVGLELPESAFFYPTASSDVLQQ